jgi:hypothetical protein
MENGREHCAEDTIGTPSTQLIEVISRKSDERLQECHVGEQIRETLGRFDGDERLRGRFEESVSQLRDKLLQRIPRTKGRV